MGFMREHQEPSVAQSVVPPRGGTHSEMVGSTMELIHQLAVDDRTRIANDLAADAGDIAVHDRMGPEVDVSHSRDHFSMNMAIDIVVSHDRDAVVQHFAFHRHLAHDRNRIAVDHFAREDVIRGHDHHAVVRIVVPADVHFTLVVDCDSRGLCNGSRSRGGFSDFVKPRFGRLSRCLIIGRWRIGCEDHKCEGEKQCRTQIGETAAEVSIHKLKKD